MISRCHDTHRSKFPGSVPIVFNMLNAYFRSMDTAYVIRSLADCRFDELFACNMIAFKDYPFQWSKEALYKTIQRRGYDASLSFGAFYQDTLAAFTWNGRGYFNGLKTAYDTGTGTVPAHRGKGLASKIFEYSLPFLQKAGIQQYLLEVLEENKTAYAVYAKQGFVISRNFDCFRTNINEWRLPAAKMTEGIILKPIDFSYQPAMEAMIDFRLSWQNDFQALTKKPDDFIITGAFKDETLVGYGIVEPESGDISQLAVHPDERGKGIGSAILAELKKHIQADIVKVINIPADEDRIIAFITKNGIPKIVSQFEMIKNL